MLLGVAVSILVAILRQQVPAVQSLVNALSPATEGSGSRVDPGVRLAVCIFVLLLGSTVLGAILGAHLNVRIFPGKDLALDEAAWKEALGKHGGDAKRTARALLAERAPGVHAGHGHDHRLHGLKNPHRADPSPPDPPGSAPPSDPAA